MTFVWVGYDPEEMKDQWPWTVPSEPESVPELISALSDSDMKSRYGAVWVLYQIGKKSESIPADISRAFMMAMHDSDYRVSDYAVALLSNLLARSETDMERAIKHDDPLMRSSATRAIMNADPIPRDLILRLLNDPNPRTRKAGIRALPCHFSPWHEEKLEPRDVRIVDAATGFLLEMMNDPDAEERAWAIRAGDDIRLNPDARGEALMEAVLRAMRDDDDGVRFAASAHAGSLAAKFGSEALAGRTVSDLSDYYRHEQDDYSRRWCVESLIAIGRTRANLRGPICRVLIHALRDKSTDVAEKAEWGLGHDGIAVADAIPQLMMILEGGSKEVKLLALLILSYMAHRGVTAAEAADPVNKFLGDADPDIRGAAIHCLAWITDAPEAVLSAAADMLDDKCQRVRKGALNAIECLIVGDVDPGITSTDTSKPRISAVVAKKILPASVVKKICDTSLFSHVTAMGVMVKLCEMSGSSRKTAVELVRRMLEISRDPTERRDAVCFLGQIARRYKSYRKLVPLLYETAAKDRSRFVREMARHVLRVLDPSRYSKLTDEIYEGTTDEEDEGGAITCY